MQTNVKIVNICQHDTHCAHALLLPRLQGCGNKGIIVFLSRGQSASVLNQEAQRRRVLDSLHQGPGFYTNHTMHIHPHPVPVGFVWICMVWICWRMLQHTGQHHREPTEEHKPLPLAEWRRGLDWLLFSGYFVYLKASAFTS